MLKALLHITMPEDDGEDRHFAPIVLALEAMCAVNEWHIRRNLKRVRKGETSFMIPPLYASGVVYKEDPPGEENWCDCLEVLNQGHGDCDRLVAWRVAELRAAGVPAEPVIKWQQLTKDMMVSLGYPSAMIPTDGVSMIHCLVRYPRRGGEQVIEDPSKRLGMGGQYTNRV